jgi:hypothetical protein
VIFAVVMSPRSLRADTSNHSVSCYEVARVVYASNSHDIGKVLCKNESLNLSDKTVVFCKVSKQLISARSSKDLELCNVSRKLVIPCNPQNPQDRRLCNVNRSSPLDANRPVWTAPYGTVLRPQTIEFTWHPVEGAMSYRVSVNGDNNQIKVNTTNTEVQLPLRGGNISIIVQAMQGEKVIGSTQKTFDVLPFSKSKTIVEKLNQIDKFAAASSEKTAIKLAILNQSELLNDSIILVKNQIAHNETTELARILADLYLQAGMFDESQKEYESAIKLAHMNKDFVELKKAQEGYKIVLSILYQSSLPRS